MHNLIDLDKMLELESKATPGKWDLNFYGGHLFLTYPMEGKFAASEDLELMIAMRNNIREICLELKAARKVIEFYADENHWTYDWLEGSFGDYGSRARKFKKEYIWTVKDE